MSAGILTRRGGFSIVFLAAAAAVMALAGCRERTFTRIDLPDDPAVDGGGLAVKACYLSDPNEIEDLFRSFLPDSGVLPVLVAIRNNGTVPLRIHSRNGLPLRDSFAGLLLESGGRALEPLHPLDVARLIAGDGEKTHYKDIGKNETVAGVFLPPLGAWYAWKEYKSRREYKPMLERSLLPARFEGIFGTVTLRPGEQVSGYLYFAAADAAGLYETYEEKVTENEKTKTETKRRLAAKDRPGMVLRVRPSKADSLRCGCAPESVLSGPSSQSMLVRRSAGEADGHMPAGVVRLVEKDGSSVLQLARFAKEHESRLDFTTLESFSASGVSIADAEISGETCLAAVDFTRRSRAFFIDMSGDSSRVAGTADLPRRTERVFFHDGRAFAVTSDGVCRVLSPDARRTPYGKLGTGIKCTALTAEGRLLAVSGGETSLFDLSEEGFLDRISAGEGIDGDVSVIFSGEEAVYLRLRGDDQAGDTLAVFDPERLETVSKFYLGGAVTTAGPGRGGLVLQIEDGTVLVLSARPGAPVSVEGSFFLDTRLVSMAGSAAGMVTVRGDGTVMEGEYDPWLPLPAGAEAEAVLEPSPVQAGEKR